MAHQNAVLEPFVKNTATAIIRRDSDAAWDSAVLKSAPPKPQPSSSVVASTNRFKKFINTLTRESKKPELNTFRWGQGSTIADVQREANAALAAYEERGSSLKKHFLHTVGRSFSNNASAAEALLQFLPGGEYTSIVCGALTLVFKAASRTAKVREQILNCLCTLTRTVEGTKGFQKLYTGNKELWEAAESLYIALLDAVQDILAWFDDGAWLRTTRALFKQENYSRPLEDKIKTAVEIRVREFQEQLEYCQHKKIEDIHIGVDGIARSVDDLQANFQKIQVAQQTQYEELTRKLVSLLQGQANTYDWQLKTDQERREALFRLTQRTYNPMVSLMRRPPMISSSQLLSLLRTQPNTPGDDVHIGVQYGQTLPPEGQCRAASLLQNTRFQSWLKAGRCEILVVNGKDPRSQSATMSPLTYVVGLLGRTLTATQAAVPLICICGRHASPDDPLEGAAGVLRLLVFQLLTYVGDSADLSQLDYNFIEAVKWGDINHLRELFRSLIVSVVSVASAPRTIVCLMDGLSFLETTARKPGLEILIAFLQQLILDINELGGLLVFKVLLTYPYISNYAHYWFPPEAILNMDEESSGDRQGYNSVRLSSASENLILGPPSSHLYSSVP